jgi:uncharacterized protein YyaL (SSP411 family)
LKEGPTVYLCQDYSCQPAITESSKLKTILTNY